MIQFSVLYSSDIVFCIEKRIPFTISFNTYLVFIDFLIMLICDSVSPVNSHINSSYRPFFIAVFASLIDFIILSSLLSFPLIIGVNVNSY